MDRQRAYDLMCEYTTNDSLRRHMLTVETSMRAYAQRRGQDVEKWGIVGLLHDFDYERWPQAPDHPLQGAKILAEQGYPDDVIYAIKSHVVETGYPPVSMLDKTLCACDELCGFITAVALVRPSGIHGLNTQSVIKKLKQKSFAEKISRQEIVDGARLLEVDLPEHIQFVIQTLAARADSLQLNGSTEPRR